MWCGQVIPVKGEVNIFSFLNFWEGADIVEIQEKARFTFEITKDQFNYWLGEWRYTRR